MDTRHAMTTANLESVLKGQMLCPGDAGYDEARTVWNAMIDRRPAIIARCADAADVVQCVRFGREHDMPIAVRGGGHNIAGLALVDGGLVIDCSRMKAVSIDPAARRATVQPGATLHDFDHEAQAHGLATPLGINSTTGVAGLTLGGGFGWLSRKYGMTVDNLISAQVVTAGGEQVRAAADDNPDLFWAIRGGGGNFGVVTSFEFQLHPVGPEILAGLLVFPLDDAKNILRQYRAFVDSAPDDMSVWVVLRKAPPLPFLTADVHGKDIVVLALCHTGDLKQGQGLIDSLRKFGRLYGEHVGAMPYEAWQQAFDPLLTPGARNYWKSHNFSTLPDAVIDRATEYAARVPTSQCEIFFGLVGGQASRIAQDATAYPHRDTKWAMNVHGRWERPDDDRAVIDWAREYFAATAPYATGGVYVNFLTEDETERAGAAYGAHHDRLVTVKNKYDPDNVFRANWNIRPARV